MHSGSDSAQEMTNNLQPVFMEINSSVDNSELIEDESIERKIDEGEDVISTGNSFFELIDPKHTSQWVKVETKEVQKTEMYSKPLEDKQVLPSVNDVETNENKNFTMKKM